MPTSSPSKQSLFRQIVRNWSLIDSTVQKATQQRVVEHEEPDKVRSGQEERVLQYVSSGFRCRVITEALKRLY